MQPTSTADVMEPIHTLSPPPPSSSSSFHHQNPQPPPFDSTCITTPPLPSSTDEFLDQILAGIPASSSWHDLSSSSNPWDLLSSSEDSPAASDSSAIAAAAKSLFLQHQLHLLARGGPGAGGVDPSGLMTMSSLPMILANGAGGDSVDDSSLFFVDRSDQLQGGGDGSTHPLYNGFGDGDGQNIGNQNGFSQGGIEAAENYGGGDAAMTTAAAAAAGIVGGQGQGIGPPPAQRQRVRARRGQATDPHSIAERLRRERIAERMKALQEMVPNANKTDKASMLDEIIDYVKFLQLQVKVLSMSRLGGAAAVAPLVADLSSEAAGNAGRVTNGDATHTATNTTTTTDNLTAAEHQVAKLMEEDMGSAMQYLQGKGLCLMPISLATAISTATCTSSRPTASARNHRAVNGVGSGATDVQGPSSPSSLSAKPVQSGTTTANGGGGGGGAGSPVKDTVGP